MPTKRKKALVVLPEPAADLRLQFPAVIANLYAADGSEFDNNNKTDKNKNVNIKKRSKDPASGGKSGEVVLPKLPRGLFWPADTFSEAQRKHGWDIVTYLDKRWGPILERGRVDDRIYASRRILEHCDPSAITAIKNYTRRHPLTGERRQLPERLHFPTLKEVTDERLAAGPKAIRDDPRLLSVVVTRLRRGMEVPGW